MTPTEKFYRISEEGLCVGCGLCQSIAGPDRIRMIITPEHNHRPYVLDELDAPLVDQIYAVCPGTRLESLPPRELDQESIVDPVWGPYRSIVLAYAADPDVRHRGSTGGVMTALALHLIEMKKVKFILHAKASTTFPTGGERQVSFDRAQIISSAGSRYGPTAPLLDFNELLERGEEFAFFGKPCDVSAIRNLAHLDRRVDRLCKYFVVMVCGGFMESSSMRGFLNDLGISIEDVVDFRYRGFGCPGPTRIQTSDGNVVEKNYLDFWGEGEGNWGLPFRCKICADGIGEAADLAATDTWPGGSPTWQDQQTDPGTNAIIVRTTTGSRLLKAAVDSGHLVVESEIDIEKLSEFQPHQVNKKYAVWARYAGMKATERLVPETVGLRVKELARGRSVRQNLAQARGTKKRIKAGKSDEPRPRPGKLSRA